MPALPSSVKVRWCNSDVFRRRAWGHLNSLSNKLHGTELYNSKIDSYDYDFAMSVLLGELLKGTIELMAWMTFLMTWLSGINLRSDMECLLWLQWSAATSGKTRKGQCLLFHHERALPYRTDQYCTCAVTRINLFFSQCWVIHSPFPCRPQFWRQTTWITAYISLALPFVWYPNPDLSRRLAFLGRAG